MIKKTKIVCTLGPATDERFILEKMLKAGMNVARFNFSHGSHTDHGRRMQLLRTTAADLGIQTAIMLDTKGPEMRIGKFTEGKVKLIAGQQFILTAEDIAGSEKKVTVSYKKLYEKIRPGDNILLADGLIILKVLDIEASDIVTVVQNDGIISDLKRVAVPGVTVDIPPLSEQDVRDILFGIEQGMDIIAASFVQRAADVLAIRRVVEEAGANPLIIAKIENAAGVDHIDDILKVADGIMVARGDLGIEIPAEEVPLVQKMIIRKCNLAGKPVITATQMLESMINSPRPTRAEASDVANAIFDGTDAVMLSGETASGKYPVEAVQIMAQIAVRTEEALQYEDLLLAKGLTAKRTTTEAISHATVQIAHELEAAAIVTSTETGYTARMVSKYRPRAAIIGATYYEQTARRMALLWGVYPTMVPKSSDSDEMVKNTIDGALSIGMVNKGDLVVVTAGVPVGTFGTTNMIRVHIVGDILLRGTGIGQKSVTGKVCVATSKTDIEKRFHPGDILVVGGINEDTAALATQASAIVSEEGGITSHAAIVGISFGLPVLVGVDGARQKLTDGMVVTVDAEKGLVYQGEINAR